jgi:hypothetical protein
MLEARVVETIEKMSDEELTNSLNGLTDHLRWLAANRETIEFVAPVELNELVIATVAEMNRRDK